jgi:ribosomal protein S18 acetylase RimI-like enzyme
MLAPFISSGGTIVSAALMNISNFTFRRLDRTDEPFLWEMLYHALYVPEGQPPFPKETIYEPELAKYVDQWGRDSDSGYVVIDNMSLQPVGAAWTRLFKGANKGYGYVNDDTPELSIALLPEYRNIGIGTSLLNQLINDARDKYPALSLSVSAGNPATRLYKRLGFEIVEENGASLTMRKQLRQP